MRILVVNWLDRLNPQAGGAETHLHEIFGRLARRGHEVTVLASGWEGAAATDTLDDMSIYRVGGRWSFAWKGPGAARRLIASLDPQVVVEDLNKVPLFLPRHTRKPLVLLVHHLFGATAFREAAPPVALATWLLERPVGRVYRASPVVAVSRSTASDLESRGIPSGHIQVIPNGVDSAAFSIGAARTPDPTLLYLGRLKRYKRVDLILRAVARLRDRGIDVRLVVAGKGDHSGPLKALSAKLGLQNHVSFPGFVSPQEKRRLLGSAWVHVLTSPREGWGIVNVEAAAAGTPTVASDSPGLRDSVVDGETGLLVPHGNVEALATALQQLLQDASLRERMGRAGREFAQGFTWEAASRQMETVLQREVAPDTPFG
ncbi:MAG: glycosyltransferase family 4 protein [Gemmatimonadota bacterium]